MKRSPETMVDWAHVREHARAPRVRVSIPVLLEVAPNCTVKARIANVSQGGFRLAADAVLQVGQTMKMHLPRESVSCELCWADGLEAGGIFHDRAELRTW